MTVRPLVNRARAVLRRFRDDDAASAAAEQNSLEQPTVVEESKTEGKRDPAAEEAPPVYESHPELPHENVQHGVSDVEAITLTWSKKTLAFVFIK
jgi:hypothetical protein